MSTPQFKIVHKDFRKALPTQKDAQLVLTDPPYNRGFDYGPVSDKLKQDEYDKLLQDMAQHAYNITKNDGSLVIIHYAEDLARMWQKFHDIGWECHQWITWCYPANFGHSKKKWTRASRVILWLRKGNNQPKFHPERVTQPYKNPNDKRIKKLIASGKTGTHLYDWWEVNLCKNVSKQHAGYSNQIPEEILTRIIKCLTDEGDLVVDPFAGSGSTIKTAYKLNRNGFGCDLNPDAKVHWTKP